MASNLLSQVLFTIPRNPTQSHPRTLGCSAFVSRHPSPVNLARASFPRVSSDALGSSFDPVTAKLGALSFVVRAESSSGGEAEATESVEESEAADSEAPEVEAEAEAEVQEEEKPPRDPRVKLGDIMGILNKRAIEASEQQRPVPDLRTGDIVEIKLEVPENRRRLSIYKGIVISKQNAGIHTTIRIRRIIAGIGVEIVFPVYSPNIKEIKVLSHRKVRRARLYYLREKLPRLSTFK
ncbi:50S ribosomal protein L19-1, chloroplastic [Diospyros lotus]|uniref:50S ribosomal protein L19-1, chloroplastic n=1 Tax=Diospyros lotus TaxID=55363 RepID=UPI0022580D36|nr:50S ribosomal protein L19-1, chloroplastic [Diospyros lotus]